MIESFLAKLVTPIVALGMGIGSFFAPAPATAPTLGVALPQGVAVFETTLASPITNSATSMTLTSNSVRGGGSLSGYQCFTIDEGSAQAEYVCGSVSGTAVTSMERGISPADGITEDTDLQFSHRRGASVKITDFPLLQRIKRQNAGESTFESALSYASGVTPTSGSNLTDKEYVDSVVNGGTLSYDQIVIAGTAGATIATGTIVYLNPTDQEWYKADNDDSTTYVDRTLGIAQGPGTDGASISGGVLTYGLDANQSGLTAGSLYFLSGTAGEVTTSTTSQPLGRAESATQLFFDPSGITADVYIPVAFSATTTFSGVIQITGTSTGSGNYQVFTSSSTWSKPTGAKFIRVIAIGGGGGGGGGSVDTSASYGSGGGGGGGGGFSDVILNANTVTTTVMVTVGSGGAGGAGYPSGGQGAGSNGSAGGTSSFGTYVKANGGSGGTGGQTGEGASAGGAGGAGLTFSGTSGGNGGTTGAGSSATDTQYNTPTGGGGGGAGGTGNADGGDGGDQTVMSRSGGAGGTGNTEDSGDAGSTFATNEAVGGTGGGGGEGSDTPTPGNPGSGGAGALYGGGGGGGGSSISTTYAGANGGAGANGIVVVITY